MTNIDDILERYFEGLTTLDEEKELRQFFSQTDIPEKYLELAPMFNYFGQEIEHTKPEANLASKPTRKRIHMRFIYSGAAAMLALLIVTKLVFLSIGTDFSTSSVYVNGKKISDTETLGYEALNSLENVTNMEADAINSQISLLDSFTE